MSDFYDEGSLKRALKNWHPMHNPILVASPSDPEFVCPSACDSFYSHLQVMLYRQTLAAVVVWIVVGCLGIVAFATHPSSATFGLVVMGFIAAGMLGFDYALFLRNREWLHDRTIFFFWLRSGRVLRRPAAICAAFFALIGGAQLILQIKLGGLEEVVAAYGTIFSSVREGDIWRLVIGPMFHGSVIHFASNFVSLLFFGSIAGAVIGARTIPIFLAGSIFGAGIQMLWATEGFDAYLGVSGGVFSVAGLLIGSGFLNSKLMPRGLPWLLAGIAAIMLIVSELLFVKGATVSHLSGFLLGICGALVGNSVDAVNLRHQRR